MQRSWVESRWSPDFFQASSFQFLKMENLLQWSFFTLIYNRSSKMKKKRQKKNELFHILHIIDHVSCLKIFATHHETRGFTSRPGESPSRIGGLAGRKNAKKNKAHIQPSWPNKTGQVAKKNTVSCTTKAASPGNPEWAMGPFCLRGSQLKTHDSL